MYQALEHWIQSRHRLHEPPAARQPRLTSSTTTAAEDAAQNRYKSKSFEPKVFKIDNILARGVDYHHSKRRLRTPSPTPLLTPPKSKVRRPPRYPFSKPTRSLITPNNFTKINVHASQLPTSRQQQQQMTRTIKVSKNQNVEC